MSLIFLLLQIMFLCCKQYGTFDPDNLIDGNLKRRNIIPLNKINRRWFGSKNLNYRRTKDIQDDIADKRMEWNNMAEYAVRLRPMRKDRNYNEAWNNVPEYQDTRSGPKRGTYERELTEQLSEHKVDNSQLEKMHRELRWLTINSDEGINIGIR